MALVDTPVWSLALRRETANGPEAAQLAQMIRKNQVAIIGPIRQEVLSGVRTTEQFSRVRDQLRAFDDTPLQRVHFARAAEFYNACRARGVQGSHTDFLICAVASMERLAILTTDRDFGAYARHLPIRLI
jgi:hypothetical protein